MVESVATEAANIGYLRGDLMAEPAPPATGFAYLYFGADKLLYTKDDAGLLTGPLTIAATVILAPTTSVRNIIEPTTGDYIPLTVRGYASAQTADVFVAQEGSADTEVFSISGIGRTALQPFTDTGGYAFKVANKAASHDIIAVRTDGFNDAVAIYTTLQAGGAKTNNRAIAVQADNDSGDVLTNAVGVYVYQGSNNGGGSITNAYGLYVEDVTSGGTTNYSIYTKVGNVALNAFNGTGNTTIGGTSVSVNYDLGLVGDGVLMQKETTTPTADTNYGKTYWKNDNKFYGQDGAGAEHVIHGFPTFKSYTVTTQGLGANPDIYAAGYYDFSVSDPALNQGNLTQAIGAANLSLAAHAFIVTQAAGSVDAGVVGIKVTGISITDAGVRNASDEEVLLADITAATANTYYETSKKWLGAPVFTLYTVSGSPTTYNLALNYGLCKYEDFGNNDFTVTDVEAVGLAGAADNDFDIKLLHHTTTGWTYNNGAFTPIIAANTIASLVGDHGTDDKLASSGNFAWKRASGIDTAITGSGGEGVMFFISSTANSAVEYANLHVGVEF